MKTKLFRRVPVISAMLGLCVFALNATAAPQPTSINITPTITNLSVVNGQILASGTATANIRGRVFTTGFTNIPVNIGIGQSPTNPAPSCPVLNLSLGPINLDILGLVVQTSPICLDITALPTGGLLGQLLCNISTSLGQGLPLGQILALLNGGDLNILLSSLTQLLNGALGNLLNAVLSGITGTGTPGGCGILNLTLGPLDLNLLGLGVTLDNCSGGPVTVTISAHRGALLGNLLCNLTRRNLTLGMLLGDILDELLNAGPL